MFWGLIMEPGKKYSQTVEKSFHVSHAALDLDSAHSSPVQVLLGFEGRNYLICTLNKDKWIQVSLDLNFQVGDKVSFATNGPGHVHLTGFLIPEEDLDILDEELSDEEEDEELLPINNKKRKSDTSNESINKRPKSETAKLLDEINEDDTDDEDDSDVNLTDLLDEEAGEEEADDEEDEAVEEDDDDDDDDDDDEAEESEEEEEEQLVQPPKKEKETPKQNGIVKNEKHKKQKGDKSPKQNNVEKTPNKEQKSEKSPKGKRQSLKGGVVVEDLKVGDGAVAIPGKQVQVYYEGRLQSNNKIFDATKKGNGFKFRLGKQEVIKGWDVGVTGMKVGGKRRITCPPLMAYGAQGSPPVIPPQSTLVFEVELRNVK